MAELSGKYVNQNGIPEDLQNIRGLKIDEGISHIYTEMLAVIKRVSFARPTWNFKMYGGYNGNIAIYLDSEEIGKIEMEYSRSSYKLVVESKYIEKSRGDAHKKKLRTVATAEKCILEYCKPRTPQGVIEDLSSYYSFDQAVRNSGEEMVRKVKNIVFQEVDTLINFCVNGGEVKDEKLVKLIAQVQKQKAECEYIRNRQAGAGFYVWQRKSGWWVYAQTNGKVQDVRQYKDLDDMPPELSEKVAVLQMLDKKIEDHFEPGVGRKNDNKRFWVIA